MKRFLLVLLVLVSISNVSFANSSELKTTEEKIYHYSYCIPQKYHFSSEQNENSSITHYYSLPDSPNATVMVNVTILDEQSISSLNQDGFNQIVKGSMPGTISYLETLEKDGMLMCIGGGMDEGLYYATLTAACKDSLFMMFFSDTASEDLLQTWKEDLLSLSESVIYHPAEETDLSSMNYQELVALKDQINLAIWNSQEWQRVEAPHGVWVVGEDIPAGKWTISVDSDKKARVDWGDKLDPSGWGFEWGTIWMIQFLYGENEEYNSGKYPSSITWDLREGHYIIVQEGTVYFTPYSGKPSLGFK